MELDAAVVDLVADDGKADIEPHRPDGQVQAKTEARTRMTEASPQEAVGKCPPHDPLDASPAANTSWMWTK